MKALLFDLDGVLVDVAGSYRRAIRETFRFFADAEIDEAAIRAYKDGGGLNDDWDLTLTALRDRGIAVERGRVVEAFQEIYLGKNFDGLIGNEKWLLRGEALKDLFRTFDLGIVTGRPAAETRFTLEHFGFERFFPVVITRDDLPEGRGKPDPLGIRSALAVLGRRQGFYAGDTVDDMRAARAAGLVPIGVVSPGDAGGDGSVDTAGARLLAAGAHRIVRDINRIGEIWP